MLTALMLALGATDPVIVSVKDPSVGGARREYRGTPLILLLPTVARGDSALVRCRDGFVALFPLDVVRRYGPIVASEVLGEHGWQPIPDPRGPRYLVWPNQTHPEIDRDPLITSEGWAWGFDEVKLVFSSVYLAPLTPEQATPSMERGRALWLQSCFHCHATHGAGGLVGWDLSEPTPLWDYRTEAEIDRYLRDPRAVNPGGHMPAQHLTASELGDLFAFMHAVLR